MPTYKLNQTLPLLHDTDGGQTTEGVCQPPNIPVDRGVVSIESVLHVTEELSQRLH